MAKRVVAEPSASETIALAGLDLMALIEGLSDVMPYVAVPWQPHVERLLEELVRAQRARAERSGDA